MKTAILTVGTEILFGQIVNTNAAFLSQQLNHLGYPGATLWLFSDASTALPILANIITLFLLTLD